MWETAAITAAIILASISMPLLYHLAQRKKPGDLMLAMELVFFVNCLILEIVYLQGDRRTNLVFATILSFMIVLIFFEIFQRQGKYFYRFLQRIQKVWKQFLELLFKDLSQLSFLMANRSMASSLAEKKKEPSPLSPRQLPSLEDCLNQSEKDMDLLLTMIIMARESDPHIEVERVARDFHNLLGVLRKKKARWERKEGALHPEEMIQMINFFLFETLEFEVDQSPQKHNDLDNLLIHRILHRRKGYCLSLCALYLIVSERLNLPIFGVSVPGHFFLRYDSGDYLRNIETTSSGIPYSDNYYRKRYHLQEKHIEQGLYLSNLRKREVIVEFLNNRGNFYYRHGEVHLAERDFNRSIAFSINFVAGYTSKGFLALRRGELKEAREQFEKALEIDPLCKMALHCIAEIHMRIGNLEEAEKVLEKILNLETDSPQAYTNLGLIYSRRGDLEKALVSHEKALFLDPGSLYALNNLGTTYYRMKKYDEAIASFHYALNLNPHFFPAMHNIIRALKSAGMKELAQNRKRELIEYYQTLLRREPEKDKYLFELAKLLKSGGEDLSRAESLIREALEIRPDYPEYIQFLATCLWTQNKEKEAISLLETYLRESNGRFLFDRQAMKKRLDKYRRQIKS